MPEQPVISVVMPHVSRSDLLRRTLVSLAIQNDAPPFEVVVVNDAQRDEQLVSVCRDFRDRVNIRLFDTHRNYRFRGPAYPWNCAVQQARGQFILMQSPECLHVGPVLRGMAELLGLLPRTVKPYYCCQCYELQREDNRYLDEHQSLWTVPGDFLRRFGFPTRPCYVGPTNPRYFYFAAGMRRQDYIDLGGLDERFTHLAYEDDWFAFLTERHGFCRQILGDSFFVLHQYHNKPNNSNQEHFQATSRMARLFQMLTNGVRAGLPPVANWGAQAWGQLPDHAEVEL